MDAMIRYIQQALPDRQYLDLVNYHLLGRTSSDRLVDPFAPDIAEDRIGDAYVAREDVEAAVRQPGCSILLGESGIGKTTLAYYFVNKIARDNPRALVISVPIPKIRAALDPESFNAGKVSILTAKSVATLIFKEFWKTFIVGLSSPNHLETLRKNRGWMEELRDFYGMYASAGLSIEDFELGAWLHPQHDPPRYPVQETSEANLQRLLMFVTRPEEALRDVWGKTKPWPYQRVRLFIDGTEHFSGPAVQRLARDAQQLYSSYRETLDLKLFIDAAWENTIRQLSCVQQGRVPLYTLPVWTRAEFHTLLEKRISAHLPSGESEDALTLEHGAKRLPMPRQTQEAFFDLILEAAPKERPPEIGAASLSRSHPTPLQILRLARGVLAAVGTLKSDKSRPTKEELKRIVNAYWDRELKEKEWKEPHDGG